MPAERAPSLREVEERLYRLITAPTGVADGLDALGLTAADLEKMVRSDAKRSAVGRLDVYAEMYFFRIRDALQELFPALAVVLGEVDFHNLVTDYLLVHPSAHPSLRNVGDPLPGFLAQMDDPRSAWLAELTRLEHARNQVFDGPDAEILTIEALNELPPEAFAALPLALVPSLVRIELAWSVERVWSQATLGEEIVPPEPEPHTLLVWRREVDVFQRVLEPDEAEVLALAAEERPFGAICDALVARAPEADEPEVAQRAFQLLAQWIGDGLLRRVGDGLLRRE